MPILPLGSAQGLVDDATLREWLAVLSAIQKKIESGVKLTAGEEHELRRIVHEMGRACSPINVVADRQQGRLPFGQAQ